MRNIFKFAKPRGPGFGINGEFYLSVLSTRSVLPPILQLINPGAVEGAVEGFGAPLTAGADKAALSMPMERGNYVLASRDRKTILRLTIYSKEEAGFDPAVYARSSLAIGAPQELTSRMLATWQILQLRFESHDPDVYPACRLLLNLAARLAALCEGVVADPLSSRYLLPEQVFQRPAADERIDARDFVAVRTRPSPNGLHVHTAGMRKFTLPEFEMDGVQEEHLNTAGNLLYSLCQARLLGSELKSGNKVGAKKSAFELREGGLDRALWEGIAVLELLPPTGMATGQALQAWSDENALAQGSR